MGTVAVIWFGTMVIAMAVVEALMCRDAARERETRERLEAELSGMRMLVQGLLDETERLHREVFKGQEEDDGK